MKPMPAKPRIIIAHVEGSGTAENRNRSQIAKLEIVESNRSPRFRNPHGMDARAVNSESIVNEAPTLPVQWRHSLGRNQIVQRTLGFFFFINCDL
jgi:hypothetical protein